MSKYIFAKNIRPSSEKGYLTCDPTDLTKYVEAKPVELSIPATCRYNGGMRHEGTWYEGVKVPDPIVPATHELTDLGYGFQYNAQPPLCKMLLSPRD